MFVLIAIGLLGAIVNGMLIGWALDKMSGNDTWNARVLSIPISIVVVGIEVFFLNTSPYLNLSVFKFLRLFHAAGIGMILLGIVTHLMAVFKFISLFPVGVMLGALYGAWAGSPDFNEQWQSQSVVIGAVIGGVCGVALSIGISLMWNKDYYDLSGIFSLIVFLGLTGAACVSLIGMAITGSKSISSMFECLAFCMTIGFVGGMMVALYLVSMATL